MCKLHDSWLLYRKCLCSDSKPGYWRIAREIYADQRFPLTLSNPDLSSFDLTNPADPIFAGKTTVDWSAETLYPFKDKLFVGGTTGMFIFDIQSNPAVPQAVGQFTHIRSCDPVVTDGNYAYVTLSSGTPCMGFDNELDIVDISNLAAASLKKTYPLTHPLGLG